MPSERSGRGVGASSGKRPDPAETHPLNLTRFVPA
jgi:hypothetical protein